MSLKYNKNDINKLYGDGNTVAKAYYGKNLVYQYLYGDFSEKIAFSLTEQDGTKYTVGCNQIQNGVLTRDNIGTNRSASDIYIGDCVTSIGDNAFNGFSNVSGDLIIPDSVTTIGEFAFSTVAIGQVTLGKGLKSIVFGAFYACKSITAIYCKSTTPPTLGDLVFYDTNNCPIYVPCDSVGAYKSANNWSTYADRIKGWDFDNDDKCPSKEIVYVDLQDQWQPSTSYGDITDITEYDFYESFSNYKTGSGRASMIITISGYDTFTFKVRNDSESSYDYVVVNNLDDLSSPRWQPNQGDGLASSGKVYYTNKGNSSKTEWYDVTFNNLAGEEHKIMVTYGKDGSVDTEPDKGYVAIPFMCENRQERWVEDGEICVVNDLYTRLKKQFKCGESDWTDIKEYKTGELIENNSDKCQYIKFSDFLDKEPVIDGNSLNDGDLVMILWNGEYPGTLPNPNITDTNIGGYLMSEYNDKLTNFASNVNGKDIISGPSPNPADDVESAVWVVGKVNDYFTLKNYKTGKYISEGAVNVRVPLSDTPANLTFNPISITYGTQIKNGDLEINNYMHNNYDMVWYASSTTQGNIFKFYVYRR